LKAASMGSLLNCTVELMSKWCLITVATAATVVMAVAATVIVAATAAVIVTVATTVVAAITATVVATAVACRRVTREKNNKRK